MVEIRRIEFQANDDNDLELISQTYTNWVIN